MVTVAFGSGGPGGEKEGERKADRLGPPDHGDRLPLDGNLVVPRDREGGERDGRGVTGIPGEQPTEILGSDAVNVLLRPQLSDCRPKMVGGRQRMLDQHRMHRRVPIEMPAPVEQVAGRPVGPSASSRNWIPTARAAFIWPRR